ncbi:hypothetical protein ACHAPB_004635 [Verticillium nonalfalfae]
MATSSSSPRPPAYDEDSRSDGTRDNWEDWEDEEVVTPIMDDEQALIADKAAMPSPLRPSKPTISRASLSRQSVHRLRRLKSRHRQRDQNAKAGIKVVTNMTELRRQHHLANSPHRARGKFVDAAALKALEGEPSSASATSYGAPIAYDAPPVPAVPETFKRPEVAVAVVLQQKDDDDDEDDGGSPCTLFEEDGNSMAVTASKTNKAKGVSKSPSSAETQTRGWWDTIVTPFTEKTSPLREAQESRFPKGSLSPDSFSKPNAEKIQFAKSINQDSYPPKNPIPLFECAYPIACFFIEVRHPTACGTE